MNYQAAEFGWTMHRLGKCHSSNYRLCAYIRKPKKGRFYTCIFIEKGFLKAWRTDNFKKKAVFVCTFRADRGKNGQNAHIKSMEKPFSYVRLSQIIAPHRSNANHTAWVEWSVILEVSFKWFLSLSSLHYIDFVWTGVPWYSKSAIRYTNILDYNWKRKDKVQYLSQIRKGGNIKIDKA